MIICDGTCRQPGTQRSGGQSVTQQLLASPTPALATFQTLDVNALVRQFEPLIRRAVGESIGLEVALCHEPLVCEVDRSQLGSALLNLAVNSRDAMPRGARSRYAPARRARRRSRPSESHGFAGPWIVAVDRGQRSRNAPKKSLTAFLSPFHTKEPGKGSGLVSPGSMASCGSLALRSRSRVLWELVHACRSTYRPPPSHSANQLP